jgi:hypothetical protein
VIVHDFADTLPTLIGRAILTIAATTALGAALLVLAVVLITSAVTGAIPTLGRRTAEEPTTEYEEAA